MRAIDERHDVVRNDGAVKGIVRDVSYIRDRIVNVFFFGEPGAGDRNWVLIDAGLGGSAARIERVAAERFGQGARPAAIILTHGHFDHVGAVKTLAARWDATVYAHDLEMPYLTGRSSYPPPDPTVGGGAMAALSRLYPRGPIDLGARVRALPEDRSVPGMPGWRWIHTPGHTAGHISLFRDSDRLLIAGDAFVTTKQESAMAVMSQRLEIHGPPMYYTPDWAAARDSVERLAALEPAIAATGHGVPWSGPQMLGELQELARRFDELAVPAQGRYVNEPAIMNADGVVTLPPPVADPLPKLLAAAAIVAAATVAVSALRRRDSGTESRYTD
jgi:glyoxylase-like metal-dependent hydrolase (beta-lactamase superfamily II)